MRVSITFPILLMFIILPTLIISITDVNAASKLTLDEFDSENDSIDIETEDQETSDDTSSESSSDIQSEDFTDVETEKSAETTSDFMSNTSTTSPAPESTTMFESNLLPENQTSNQTEKQADTMLTLQEKLSKGIITDNTIFTPRIYQVTVVFDSITVHEDHEGLVSGDGEYELHASVQGKVFDLTDASIPGDPYHYPGDIPSAGLGDVSEGETVQFLPEARVTLDLLETTPLSIFTWGAELDSCGYEKDSPSTLPKALIEIFKNPQLDWLTPITQYISSQDSNDCGYDDSEVLGNIVKFYNPPGQSYEPIGYGAGAHTNVVSSKGDYTLRYTIAVTPPPPPPTASQKQLDPGKLTNEFQSNNMGIFNK